MNLHYKISPGIGLSNNQAMEMRCLKALQLMRQASVVCGGGGGIKRQTGDLEEVDNKQFPDGTSSKSLFPRRLRDDGDEDER
jgi:hypothetical protein